MINEWLMRNRKNGDPNYVYPVDERITCKDGFSLSVQASSGHYCTPRNNFGPWRTVEVGYPSSEPEFIGKYAEEWIDKTKAIYPFVPVDLVDKLLDLHGGIDE